MDLPRVQAAGIIQRVGGGDSGRLSGLFYAVVLQHHIQFPSRRKARVHLFSSVFHPGERPTFVLKFRVGVTNLTSLSLLSAVVRVRCQSHSSPATKAMAPTLRDHFNDLKPRPPPPLLPLLPQTTTLTCQPSPNKHKPPRDRSNASGPPCAWRHARGPWGAWCTAGNISCRS